MPGRQRTAARRINAIHETLEGCIHEFSAAFPDQYETGDDDLARRWRLARASLFDAGIKLEMLRDRLMGRAASLGAIGAYSAGDQFDDLDGES